VPPTSSGLSWQRTTTTTSQSRWRFEADRISLEDRLITDRIGSLHICCGSNRISSQSIFSKYGGGGGSGSGCGGGGSGGGSVKQTKQTCNGMIETG
jgi:hypothetical protein